MSDATLGDLLRCPACQDMLETEASGELLRCQSCGLAFPVVDGIPRIFVGDMRRIYAQDFSSAVRKYPELAVLPASGHETRDLVAKLQTRESFGYEWSVYSEMLAAWEANARFYFEPIGLERLSGKRVLDAGCGKGRHVYYAVKAGAHVVALDFSRAIDVARRNCASMNVQFVQADLTAPPLRRSAFDLVYSFGVLHHLPDPEGGFRSLLPLVRTGGEIAVFLYHWPEGQPIKQGLLRGVAAVRQLTTRMPYPLLRAFSAVAGVALYGAVVMPSRMLARGRFGQRLVGHLPLQAYARYPIRVIINDQFDRFSAPIEHRYRELEVKEWFERAGLTDIRLLPGFGWRAAGRIPLTGLESDQTTALGQPTPHVGVK